MKKLQRLTKDVVRGRHFKRRRRDLWHVAAVYVPEPSKQFRAQGLGRLETDPVGALEDEAQGLTWILEGDPHLDLAVTLGRGDCLGVLAH